MTKNADSDKRSNFGYHVLLYTHGSLSLSYGGIGKSVIIFGAGISSSGYIDNKKKYFLILEKGRTQGYIILC